MSKVKFLDQAHEGLRFLERIQVFALNILDQRNCGRGARIEGDLQEGQRVLFVEDLTTDGGSKVSFAEAIREAGAQVTDTFSVFYYDIFKDAPDVLASHGMKLHYLTTWPEVLKVARKENLFDKPTLDAVEEFLNDPYPWSAAKGGISERA